MPVAQLGSEVLLAYRKPQAQQLGDSVVLNYNAGSEDPYFVPMFGGSVGRWGKSVMTPSTLLSPLPKTGQLSEGPQSPWGIATKLATEPEVGWSAPNLYNESKDAPWTPTQVLEVTEELIPWGQMFIMPGAVDGAWGSSKESPLAREILIPWGLSIPQLQSTALPWRGQVGGALYGERRIPWGLSIPASDDGLYPWDRRAPSHDHLWNIVYPSGPTTDNHGTIVILARKAYVMKNEIKARTMSGGVEIPLQAVSLNLDYGTWAWGFSATIPATYLSYLQSLALTAPVELLVTVNGEDFLVLVESVSRSRTFGKASLSITGRGHSAYLSDPYSPTNHSFNSEMVTSQQLFESALTFNTVPLGWTVNWNLPVWNIPAGVWSHTGTYIEAITAIASSVGGYILPDPVLKVLNVNSKYPTLPSEWAAGTPYMILPSAVVQTEGVVWKEKPAYNGVYVSGESSGITGFVHKDGTIGDYLAESKTHKLITHADAARELGRSILVDTGFSSLVTLSMPILDSMGLILPGNIIRYTDGGSTTHGITRSIAIASNGVSARQTIEVEVHA